MVLFIQIYRQIYVRKNGEREKKRKKEKKREKEAEISILLIVEFQLCLEETKSCVWDYLNRIVRKMVLYF